jgi:hypothetical protein
MRLAVPSTMRAAILVVLLLSSGCYHYSFEQASTAPGRALVTYQARRPTYLNGLIGTGRVDTSRYCADPVRTELRVTTIDVLVSIATLLIYTPHTLYVTCDASETARR